MSSRNLITYGVACIVGFYIYKQVRANKRNSDGKYELNSLHDRVREKTLKERPLNNLAFKNRFLAQPINLDWHKRNIRNTFDMDSQIPK